MNSWNRYFILLIAIILFQRTYAEEVESAPQEPPYVQEENEFELSPKTTDDEVLSIEDEVKSATEETNGKAADSSIKKEDESLVPVEKEGPAVAEEPEVVPSEPEETFEPSEIKPKVARKPLRGNVEYIEHPLAAKGLTTITKDGAYIFKTEDIKHENKSGILRFATMDPPKIESSDGATSFETMYSSDPQPVIMFDYEWHPFDGYGKLGLQAGFGFLIAYGSGRFTANSINQGKEAKEKYTFVALPLNLGAVYRLEWMDRQWLAPYVVGGGTYIPVVEIRDDNKNPSAVGVPGAYGGGGVLFNISALNRDTAFTLKSEYGITNLWVSLDYKYLQTFNEELDFSSSIIGAGVAVDY